MRVEKYLEVGIGDHQREKSYTGYAVRTNFKGCWDSDRGFFFQKKIIFFYF